MDIAIRRVTRPLWLREFAEEYDDIKLDVWVNPTRGMLTDYGDIQKASVGAVVRLKELAELVGTDPDNVTDKEKASVAALMDDANNRTFAWYADVWSQGNEEITPDEVREFSIRCQEDDPALWEFILNKTWELINDHRDRSKKG